MWIPKLEDHQGPLYQAIAGALERDIQSGRLERGSRLPTLKELAAALGVTPGTINRAYELAQRRGLVEGEVGRGTFVSGARTEQETARTEAAVERPQSEWIDLSIIKPNMQLQEAPLREALAALQHSPLLTDLLDYTPDGGHPLHRMAGAEWLQQAGLEARWEQVVLTAGAQHGIGVAVSALTQPGALVLCEALCYPGIPSAIRSLGRRAVGIAQDAQGIVPEALREQCRREKPAMLICIATCQNPCSSIMSTARRVEIAEIAREFDFVLVDDDLYGFLAPSPVTPLAQFAPERSLYLTSLSKSLLPGVRLGYVHGPAEWLTRLASCVRTSIWMVSPLAAQLATQLITSGSAAQLSRAQREEARARQQMAGEIFADFRYQAQPTGFHLWLELPEAWSSGEQFAMLARTHKLLVAAGEPFAVNRDGQGRSHIRISIMESTRDEMRFLLTKLAGLLRSDPQTLY